MAVVTKQQLSPCSAASSASEFRERRKDRGPTPQLYPPMLEMAPGEPVQPGSPESRHTLQCAELRMLRGEQPQPSPCSRKKPQL